MSEAYGEPIDEFGGHILCSDCGYCIDCGDCIKYGCGTPKP